MRLCLGCGRLLIRPFLSMRKFFLKKYLVVASWIKVAEMEAMLEQ